MERINYYTETYDRCIESLNKYKEDIMDEIVEFYLIYKTPSMEEAVARAGYSYEELEYKAS